MKILFVLFLFGRILFGQEIAVLQADFVKEKNTSDSTPSYDTCIKNQGLDEGSNCAKAIVIRDEHLAPNILFEGHTLKLKKYSLQLLEKYTTRVLLTPDFQVVVEGHTDSRLGNNESLKLGKDRAKVVKEHMVRMGVDPNQIRVISKGSSEPRNHCKEANTCSKEMHDENNSVLLYSNRLLTLLPLKVNDRDNDGISDDFDNCKEVRGKIQNFGCPTSKIETKSPVQESEILFSKESSSLSPKINTQFQKQIDTMLKSPTDKVILGIPSAYNADNALYKERASLVKAQMLEKKPALEGKIRIVFDANQTADETVKVYAFAK